MKRILLLSLLCLTLLNPSVLAQSIDSIFVKLQVSELSLLSRNNRLDLLDYINCGQVGTVENLFLGKTSLTKKTANYLHLEATSVNRVEMILLPQVTGDTIVAIISTLTSPVEVSRLRFYSLKGTLLHVDFNIPTLSELVVAGQSTMKKDLYFKLHVSLNFLYDEEILVCQVSKNFFTIEDEEDNSITFREIRYKWNGHSFVME